MSRWSRVRQKIFKVTFSVSDCFKILGIDQDTNLTQDKLNSVYFKAIQQAHPDKAPPDEVSQWKANDICQMIKHASDILQEQYLGNI